MDDKQLIKVLVGFLMALAMQAMYMRASFVPKDNPVILIDGQLYQQVGLMEIDDNGEKLYTPVFKKRNSK